MTKDVFCRDKHVYVATKKKREKFCREQIVIVSIPANDTDSFRELSQRVLRARHVNSEMLAPHETVQRVRTQAGRVSCDVK